MLTQSVFFRTVSCTYVRQPRWTSCVRLTLLYLFRNILTYNSSILKQSVLSSIFLLKFLQIAVSLNDRSNRLWCLDLMSCSIWDFLYLSFLFLVSYQICCFFKHLFHSCLNVWQNKAFLSFISYILNVNTIKKSFQLNSAS